MHIQDLEAKIPGIGAALVSLTKGWDNLNWLEKGLIVAAVALVGWEVLGAIAPEVGIGSALIFALKLLPAFGGSTNSGSGSGVLPPGWMQGWTTKSGVTFYRKTGTRQLGAFNKKGRFKTWTPKKPIVLYSDGTKNLKTLVRATKIIRKELAALQRQISPIQGATKKQPAEKKLTISELREMKRLANEI